MILSVLGLKCMTCTSSKSWDDCKATSQDCVSPANRCFKVYLKAGDLKSFGKGCVPEAFCDKDANPICKAATGSFECEVNCCDSDDCNAGAATRISGILLLTCAMASLMILFKA